MKFKVGDKVRIVNEKSADYGKTGQVFRAYKVLVLVTFDGRYAKFFDYSDIAPDDTPDDGGRCCDVEPMPEPDEPDMIQNPPHYNKFTFQPINIIAEVTNYYEGSAAFHIGTVLKYLCRAPFKGKMLEDLKKANYYLTRAIEEMEEEG